MKPEQMQEMAMLIKAMDEAGLLNKSNGNGLHTKAPASTNTAALLTQPGGMFAVTGMENEVISLHVSPRGIGAEIPAFENNIDDPRFGFITGFGDDIGTEPVGVCDDAPTGYMKAGTLTAAFGRIVRQTETMEIDALLKQKRGVNTDLRLVNSVLNGNVGLNIPQMSDMDLMNLVVKSQMVNVGVSMERKLSKLVWQGAIGNNTAGGGYKEFPGLDSQIATGQVDAETNTAMPAADSDIKQFNYNRVDGTVNDIVEYLSMLEYYLHHLADRTNMLPVQWAIVMRPELWFELSAVWPCRYLTDRCSDSAGTQVMTINDDNNVMMRDAMRNGMYIDINGRRYPVVVDDGIFEKTNITNAELDLGEYASHIYMVPLTVRGNFPVLYWEYIDYRNVQAQINVMGAGTRAVPFWTDTGRLLWVYRDNGFCFDLQAKTEPRLVLRTPHLAGKIENVAYSPLQHLRSPYPESPYFQDGGVSFRGTTTSNAVWGSFDT